MHFVSVSMTQMASVVPRAALIFPSETEGSLGVDVKYEHQSANAPQMLRRGRALFEKIENEARKWIFFIACNCRLERQFEFFHQRWGRKPSFGSSTRKIQSWVVDLTKAFSIRDGERREISLEACTQTMGGALFFRDQGSSNHRGAWSRPPSEDLTVKIPVCCRAAARRCIGHGPRTIGHNGFHRLVALASGVSQAFDVEI